MRTPFIAVRLPAAKPDRAGVNEESGAIIDDLGFRVS